MKGNHVLMHLHYPKDNKLLNKFELSKKKKHDDLAFSQLFMQYHFDTD